LTYELVLELKHSNFLISIILFGSSMIKSFKHISFLYSSKPYYCWDTQNLLFLCPEGHISIPKIWIECWWC